MKCLKCGYEVEGNARFCPVCGAEIYNPIETECNTLPKQAKCWSVFAKLGFGFGLAGLICSWIYTLGIVIAVHGIIFSALGLRSYEFGSKAKTGLILGIVGTVLGFIFSVMIIALLIELGLEYGSGLDYYTQLFF